MNDHLDQQLDRDRTALAGRLAVPELLDGAFALVLNEGQCPGWAGLFVPVGGLRVCGYLWVPGQLVLDVLDSLQRLAPGEFPNIRRHQPFRTGGEPFARIEWGAEPPCEAAAAGFMLGYHPDGVRMFAAERPYGVAAPATESRS
ncbi:DUF6302 family protein [Streptomyces uncialis]|uniref:DUF6302 family protein n=1 Tax=Streptomyces uncialis TaxID=1048205 RepID=UPI002E3711B4|nr:DUF6302 family protein [Streptomyces uncialis]